MAGGANCTRVDDAATLRLHAIAAASLATKSGHRKIAKLPLMVSEEMEEEACNLDLKRGDPQLEWAGRPLLLRPNQGVRPRTGNL